MDSENLFYESFTISSQQYPQRGQSIFGLATANSKIWLKQTIYKSQIIPQDDHSPVIIKETEIDIDR